MYVTVFLQFGVACGARGDYRVWANSLWTLLGSPAALWG